MSKPSQFRGFPALDGDRSRWPGLGQLVHPHDGEGHETFERRKSSQGTYGLDGDLQNHVASMVDRTMLFPQTWEDGPDENLPDGGGRRVNLPEGGRFEANLDTVPGFENVGEGLVYRLSVDEIGDISTPGAGRNRVSRFIGHPDLAGAPTVQVYIPGFAHTHRYRDAKWFVHLLAQVAQKKKMNFLDVDPLGRGVPGYDRSLGIGKLGWEHIRFDTQVAVLHLLTEMANQTKGQKLGVIVSGHSLSAKLARSLAKAVFGHQTHQPESPFQLGGVILEAPVAAGAGEDFMTLTYLRAILKHFPASVYKSLFGKKKRGLDFTLGDVVRLFQGEFGIPENVLISAMGLQHGECKHFFDITMSFGDIEEFFTTLRGAVGTMSRENGGIGAHIWRAERDGIFSQRPHDDLHTYFESDDNADIRPQEHLICGAPHSFTGVPIPDRNLVEQVKRALEATYGVELDMSPLDYSFVPYHSRQS